MGNGQVSAPGAMVRVLFHGVVVTSGAEAPAVGDELLAGLPDHLLGEAQQPVGVGFSRPRDPPDPPALEGLGVVGRTVAHFAGVSVGLGVGFGRAGSSRRRGTGSRRGSTS